MFWIFALGMIILAVFNRPFRRVALWLGGIGLVIALVVFFKTVTYHT